MIHPVVVAAAAKNQHKSTSSMTLVEKVEDCQRSCTIAQQEKCIQELINTSDMQQTGFTFLLGLAIGVIITMLLGICISD